jgi:hypothetical protein
MVEDEIVDIAVDLTLVGWRAILAGVLAAALAKDAFPDQGPAPLGASPARAL